VYSDFVVAGRKLTVDEIAKMTSYSIATVYSSLNKLIENELVEKHKEDGTVKYSSNLNSVDLLEIRKRVIMVNYLKPLIEISGKYNYDKHVEELQKYVKNMYEYFST